ncbi:MAG TPA: hypothetical protein PLG33_02360 [Prolixibacteraceae bacterium]|nr:hypothetical protein [Prolixibacteraceae bacterium]HPR84863.1 hypothetical protein [Prolixibacteraceae bacterium]
MKKLIFTGMLLIFTLAFTKAQNRMSPDSNMFEKIKAQKISFFTEKLALTPSEAQAFWPVYNEFEKKRFDIQRQKHDFERMPDEKYDRLSDSEIETLTGNYIDSFEKEAMLLKEYNKQFLKVLPKKKVLLLYRTENEFRGHLIREYRGQKRD